jgi:hypothetical protein
MSAIEGKADFPFDGQVAAFDVTARLETRTEGLDCPIGHFTLSNPNVGCCCACTMAGHATAPPRIEINSRRFIGSPEQSLINLQSLAHCDDSTSGKA